MHFYKRFVLSIYFYFTWYTEKYTDKIIHIIIRILVYSSFCLLNFMLTASKPNFLTLSAPHTRLTRTDAYSMSHEAPAKLPALICRLTLKNTGSGGHIPSCHVPQLRSMFNISCFHTSAAYCSHWPLAITTHKRVRWKTVPVAFPCAFVVVTHENTTVYDTPYEFITCLRLPVTNQTLHIFSEVEIKSGERGAQHTDLHNQSNDSHSTDSRPLWLVDRNEVTVFPITSTNFIMPLKKSVKKKS